MAKLYNLVRVNTSTTGSGTIVLGNAITGFLSFMTAGVQDGDEISYGLKDGNNYEVGRGIYSVSGSSLTRSLLDSTTGSLIELSGNTDVYITALAEDFVSDGKYLLVESNENLTEGVIIPGLAGSADIAGQNGAGTSEEYDTASHGLSWSATPSVVDSNTTIKSHLYIKTIDSTPCLGAKSWNPAGAFDARCKISFGNGDFHFGIYDSTWTNGFRWAIGVGSNKHDLYAQYSSSGTTKASLTGTFLYTIYLRLKRDGSNNITWYFSDNGIAWYLFAIQSYTFTAEKIGFRMALAGEYYVDWLRTDV
jgi:hypothetical protein